MTPDAQVAGESLRDSTDELNTDGSAFLGAVHQLVSTERAATKADLILAAASQALRQGDKTASEVLGMVNSIWPGASTDLPSVENALRLGGELGLMSKSGVSDASAVWTLTTRGVDDVDAQAGWVDALRDRTRRSLVARAEAGLGISVSDATADAWLERLTHALIQGIQSSQDAYLGNVDEIVGRRLTPRRIDQLRVFAVLDDPRIDPVTVDFLKTSAMAAFDPLEPFGSELVSHITTGCVLHSYVAGRDGAAALARIGSPEGQRALVDTPVLVDLIGPLRVQKDATTSISAAVAAGWEVIVCDHSLEELINLIEREVPRIKRDFAKAVEEGIREEWYASLVSDQLPSYCIELLRSQQYRSLEELIDAAHGLEQRLADLGVEVRPHGNEIDQERVARCRTALDTELAGSFRSATVKQRDADSMAVVWRRRRRQQASQWPGGWIITSDRHLAPAYKALQSQDGVPLTLSLAQWNTLLSMTIEPAAVVELAEAAAHQLIEEAMWLLPARFPSDVAMDLARQLGPDQGGSEMDVRYAQLSLSSALDSNGHARSGVSLASDVLAARAQRSQRITEGRVADANDARAEAERTADRARAAEEDQRHIAQLAQQASTRSDRDREALAEELSWSKLKLTRTLISVIACAVGVLSVVVVMLTAQPWWLVGVALAGCAVVAVGGYRWTRSRQSKLVPLAVGAGIEVFGLVSGAVGLANDLVG